RPIEESQVKVFRTTDDWPVPPDLEQFAGSARSVLRLFDNPIAPEAIAAYFNDLYWMKPDDQMGSSLLKRIENGLIDGIPYEDMAHEFRMIESHMLPVIVPFDDEARKLIGELKWSEKCGGIAR